MRCGTAREAREGLEGARAAPEFDRAAHASPHARPGKHVLRPDVSRELQVQADTASWVQPRSRLCQTLAKAAPGVLCLQGPSRRGHQMLRCCEWDLSGCTGANLLRFFNHRWLATDVWQCES